MKILAIDDNEAALNLVRNALEQNGFTVFTTEEIFAANQIIYKEQPDLILMDYNMPMLKGDRIIQILKGFQGVQGIPIVIFSDQEPDKLEALVQSSGADGYIPKSSVHLLATKIEEILKNRKAANP